MEACLLDLFFTRVGKDLEKPNCHLEGGRTRQHNDEIIARNREPRKRFMYQIYPKLGGVPAPIIDGIAHVLQVDL